MIALIIDDEKKARSLLYNLIKEFCPEINKTLQADSLASGVGIIKTQPIDLVFLDIEMPEESGLKILDYFDPKSVDFQLVFTTAYNQYAVEAFKLSAIEYLLKPIDIEELETTIKKAKILIKSKKNELSNKLEKLKRVFQDKIVLEVPGGILFVKQNEINYIKADGMYTHVHLLTGSTKMMSKPLRYFADQLRNNILFFRSHRSYLINLEHVKEYSTKDGLTMTNNENIPISQSKIGQFQDLVTLLN